MNTDETILRRVQALLALARNNSSSEEAEAAAAKAQELIALYNLDLTRSGVTDRNRKKEAFSGGLYKWQRTIWRQVAAMHYCLYDCQKGLTKGAKYEHILIGRQHNAASAKVLAEYLEQAINRLVIEKFGNDPRVYFSREANAYREGLADTLNYRLWLKRQDHKREEREKAERARQPSDGRALIVTLEDVEREEQWANLDAAYGREPGYHKAQDLAFKARQEARRQWEAENPEEAAAEQKRVDEEYAAWQAKQPKRKPKAEKRRLQTYYAGLEDGEQIGLDRQIDEAKPAGFITEEK